MKVLNTHVLPMPCICRVALPFLAQKIFLLLMRFKMVDESFFKQLIETGLSDFKISKWQFKPDALSPKNIYGKSFCQF
jgi:hypothetical protein